MQICVRQGPPAGASKGRRYGHGSDVFSVRGLPDLRVGLGKARGVGAGAVYGRGRWHTVVVAVSRPPPSLSLRAVFFSRHFFESSCSWHEQVSRVYYVTWCSVRPFLEMSFIQARYLSRHVLASRPLVHQLSHLRWGLAAVVSSCGRQFIGDVRVVRSSSCCPR